MSRRYPYQWGQYVRDTGASRVSTAGFIFSALFGAGLAIFLALALIFLEWPTRWAMAVMTAALLAGIGMCWVCKRFDWPFLFFFEAFSSTILIFWSLILRLEVTERVALRNIEHLTAISAIPGIWVAVKHFRWEKKYRDMSRASVFVAVIIGLCCFFLCHGALLGVNVLADSRPAQSTMAQVLRVESEWRLDGGRYTSGSYTVYFAVVKENDLTRGGTRLPVDKAAYEELKPGDEVRITLHPGALGAPWLECVTAEGSP